MSCHIATAVAAGCQPVLNAHVVDQMDALDQVEAAAMGDLLANGHQLR